MSGPMTPDDLGKYQVKVLPKEVFEVVNENIALKWTGHSAVVKQDTLVAEMLSKLGWDPGDRRAIFDNGYLNFEEAYRAVGWVVVYDKPGYNESYEAFWTFKRK